MTRISSRSSLKVISTSDDRRPKKLAAERDELLYNSPSRQRRLRLSPDQTPLTPACDNISTQQQKLTLPSRVRHHRIRRPVAAPRQRRASAPLALLTPRRAGRSCLHRLHHQLQQQQNPLQSLRTTTGKLQQEQQQQQQPTRNKCRRTTRTSTGARHLGGAHSVAYQSGP